MLRLWRSVVGAVSLTVTVIPNVFPLVAVARAAGGRTATVKLGAEAVEQGKLSN